MGWAVGIDLFVEKNVHNRECVKYIMEMDSYPSWLECGAVEWQEMRVKLDNEYTVGGCQAKHFEL